MSSATTAATTYQYKPSMIPRSGSTQRTICYSLPKSGRNFEYRNGCRTNEEITGRASRHITLPPSKEISNFSQVHVYPQPDSRRTLNPALAPEPRVAKRSCSVASLKYTPVPRSNEYEKPRKPLNPRVYQSFELTDSAKPEPYRRLMGATEFTKYENTSQISNLPGGIKRNACEIKDNYNPLRTNYCTSESFSTKLYRDYNSNISCLPGRNKNEQRGENPTLVAQNMRKYMSNDIFNVNMNKINPTNTNNFNVDNTRRENFARTFGESKSYLNYNRPTTGVRRNEMKNRSQIQLC